MQANPALFKEAEEYKNSVLGGKESKAKSSFLFAKIQQIARGGKKYQRLQNFLLKHLRKRLLCKNATLRDWPSSKTFKRRTRTKRTHKKKQQCESRSSLEGRKHPLLSSEHGQVPGKCGAKEWPSNSAGRSAASSAKQRHYFWPLWEVIFGTNILWPPPAHSGHFNRLPRALPRKKLPPQGGGGKRASRTGHG